MSGVKLSAPVLGMTWGWTGVRGTWDRDAAASSMKSMMQVNPTWTALSFAAEQESIISTSIPYDDEPTVTSEEIVAAIRRAKGLGLKVCLKPVVNVADGTWRAHIGFFDWDVPGEPSWSEWFESYSRFILMAADIAQAENCEMLCIGCEMVRADAQEGHWRRLIERVRAVYTGLITYNCDKYQEDHVSWWDAVDVISSSGYYPIDSWDAQLDRIERVVESAGKPFIFMEAGCPSREGSAQLPNDWNLVGAPSGGEQHAYYQEMFRALRSRAWVDGVVLWDWPAELYDRAQAVENDDYCPFGKPAEHLLAEQFSDWAEHPKPQ